MFKPEITNDTITATDVSVAQIGQEIVKRRLDELIDFIENLVEEVDPRVQDKMRHNMYMHVYDCLNDASDTVLFRYISDYK